MARDYDAIASDLGALGSGAAYWLAKRGARVLGLEQFELGHARGSSHDWSRIIRLSYFTPAYVRLAKEAYAAWDTLESDAGERTRVQDGRPRPRAARRRDSADELCRVDARMRGRLEELDAAEIRRRWPAWRIGDDVHGLSKPIAASSPRSARRQRCAASRSHSARICARSARVTALRARDGEIDVETDGARYRAGKLVIAAAAWTPHALAHFGMRIPFEVTQEQAIYFQARVWRDLAFGAFPIWIWMDDPSFSAFRSSARWDSVKVTQDAGGRAVDPDTRGFEEDPAITARVTAFFERYLPSALGPVAPPEDLSLRADARSRLHRR